MKISACTIGITLLVLNLGTLPDAAKASSDAAWQELAAKMTKACLKASNLDASRVVWSSLDFGSKTTALVTGKWKPKHMKGQKAAMLCLYDKHSGRAEAQEFDVQLLK